MANTLTKTAKKGTKAVASAKVVKTTGKAVKKNAQYKAAKKAASKASTRTKAAFFLAVGATTAAGAYLASRRGGGEPDTQQA
jgi:hypothetical protein